MNCSKQWTVSSRTWTARLLIPINLDKPPEAALSVNVYIVPPGDWEGTRQVEWPYHPCSALVVLTSDALNLACTRWERWSLRFQEFCELVVKHSHYLKTKLSIYNETNYRKTKAMMAQNSSLPNYLTTLYNRLCSWGHLALSHEHGENAL